MNVTDYWPMAREYSIWNATVAYLQFWTADLEVHALSSTIEQVYNAYFYSTSIHLLCQQSDEVLFSHFVTTLNEAFKSILTSEDEGYESSRENFIMPTPLGRTSKIHHVSSVENALFWSLYTMQHRYQTVTSQTCTMTFNLQFPWRWGHPYWWDSNTCQYSTIAEPHKYPTVPILPEHPKHICSPRRRRWRRRGFPNVSLGDEHWNMEEIGHLCIHEHSIPHELCPYPHPYLDYTSSLYLGFEWLFWVWRSADYIQWWRHPYPRWSWILKHLDYD